MELNHLRYFFEVAKSGSFTEAARRLRISQSALSKAVALLEDAEGVKLLERSKKGVSLTAVGSEVFRMSSGIFQTVTEIENTCRGTKEACEGLLRFGASDHVTNYLLIELLNQFRTEHPKLVPSVLSGAPNEVIAMILSHDLEFGLFFTKVIVSGIAYEDVATLPMAVVCHPKLLPAKGTGLAKLRKVVREVGFISSSRSQYMHSPSEALLRLIDVDAPTAFESNSQEAQKRFCLAGGGVAFLARFMVEKEIASGELVELTTPEPMVTRLLLARRIGVPLSLSARTLLAALPRGWVNSRR